MVEVVSGRVRVEEEASHEVERDVVSEGCAWRVTMTSGCVVNYKNIFMATI